MTPWIMALLVVLTPLLLALGIVGVVAVIAIRRVEPVAIPSVLSEVARLLEPLAQRFPRISEVGALSKAEGSMLESGGEQRQPAMGGDIAAWDEVV